MQEALQEFEFCIVYKKGSEIPPPTFSPGTWSITLHVPLKTFKPNKNKTCYNETIGSIYYAKTYCQIPKPRFLFKNTLNISFCSTGCSGNDGNPR
jgi:hypothetical protein